MEEMNNKIGVTLEQTEKEDPIEKFLVGGVTFETMINDMAQIPNYEVTPHYLLEFKLEADEVEDLLTVVDKKEEREKEKEKKKKKKAVQVKHTEGENPILSLFNIINEVSGIPPDEKEEDEKGEKKNVIIQEEPLTYVNYYPKKNKAAANPIELLNVFDQYEVIDSNPELKENRKYYPLANNRREVVSLDIMIEKELSQLYQCIPSMNSVEGSSSKEHSSIYCIDNVNRTVTSGTLGGKLVKCSLEEGKLLNKSELIAKDQTTEGEVAIDKIKQSPISAMDFYENCLVAGNEKGDFYILHEDKVVPVLTGTPYITAIKILSSSKSGKKRKIDLVIGWKETMVYLVAVEFEKDEVIEWSKEQLVQLHGDVAVCVDYYELNENSSDRVGIVAIGTSLEIHFRKINLDTKAKEDIKAFKNPRQVACDYPDICVLKGLPSSITTFKKKKNNFRLGTKSYLLNYLCISFGKEVYCIKFNKNEAKGYESQLESHYCHSAPILRIVSLSDNFIGILDKEMDLHIVATYQMAKFSSDKEEKKENDNRFNTIRFNKISLAYYEPLCHKTELVTKRIATSYRNAILPYDKGLLVFGKKKYAQFKLTNWMSCVEGLIRDGKWVETFFLTKEIFDITASLGEDEDQYKSLIEENTFQIKRLISVLHLISQSFPNKKRFFQILLELFVPSENCIMILEFIRQDIGEDKKLFSLFCHCLEHFILSKQIASSSIPRSFILKLLTEYNDYPIFLTNLLLHLKPEAFKETSNEIEEAGLIHVMIYIHLSKDKKERDFSKPIEYLFSKWEKASEKPLLNAEYEEFVLSKDLGKFKVDFAKCSSYFLHLLLWYINCCLDKHVYPSKKAIKEDKYKEIVIYIAVWLNSPQVIAVLIPFDSFSYFKMLTRIFEAEKIYSNLLSVTVSDIQKAKSKLVKTALDKGFHPDAFIEPLKAYFSNEQNCSLLAKKDYYEFMLHISKENKSFFFTPGELLVGIEFLLNYNQLMKTDLNKNDPFLCHKEDILEFEKIISQKEKEILLTLKTLQLTALDIKQLLSIAGISDFISVQIYLNEIAKNYAECLKAHLVRYNEEKNMTKEEKIRLLFKWLNDTLKSFCPIVKEKEQLPKKTQTLIQTSKGSSKSSEKEAYRNRSSSELIEEPKGDSFKEIESENSRSSLNAFKEIILADLICLLEISVKDGSALINTWFSDKIDQILHRLDEFKELKKIYVENLLNPYQDIAISSLKSEEREHYYSLLQMQIQLYYELHEENNIYEIILKNKLIMDKGMLELLLKMKSYESALVLFLFFGGFSDGVDLATNSFVEDYAILRENLQAAVFNAQKHQNSIRKLELYIENGINLCVGSLEKENLDQMQKGDQKETAIWIPLLKQMYISYNDLTHLEKNFVNNERTFNYNQMKDITVNGIKELLTQVSSFIEMTKIIEELSTHCEEAVFKEFKYVLLNTINKSNQIETILNTAQMLFVHLVEKNVFSLLLGLRTGIEVTLEKCSKCSERFELANQLFLFNCGHKFHLQCVEVDERNQILCLSCKSSDQEKGFVEKEFRQGFIVLNQELPEANEEIAKKKREDKGLKQLTSKLMDTNKRVNEMIMDLVSNILLNYL